MKKQSTGFLWNSLPWFDCRMPTRITYSSSHLPENFNYCSDAHQHYLWDTYEYKYNNIFLKEYNSDEIGEMLKYRSPGINSLN